MKPLKNAVAIVIKNEQGKFLIVKRPEDEDGPLAGVWGFPAVTLHQGETEEDAVCRAGRVKLGVALEPTGKIGEKIGDRDTYMLHLSDYRAEVFEGETPTVPQADTTMTQYTDLKYIDDPSILFTAAQKGSLCSQIYLESLNIPWDNKREE